MSKKLSSELKLDKIFKTTNPYHLFTCTLLLIILPRNRENLNESFIISLWIYKKFNYSTQIIWIIFPNYSY